MPKFSLKAGFDPTLPDVTLQIGGADRQLAFSMESIVAVERLTGINLMTAALGDVDATKIRALLYAALLPDAQNLTLEEVGGWINFHNSGIIHQAILAAWFGSVPTKEKDSLTGEEDAQAEAAA